VAGGGGWEGSPAVSVPRRPEEATFGDPRRQRGTTGCYRYPLIVNGSPRCAPGGLRVAFVRGGPGGRRRGVGRLTGRQCPKTTRGGCRWRSEAAERSVGMRSIPSDSKRLTLARFGSAPGGFARGGPGSRRRGVGRITGCQCPKTTRGGFRWRSEAAERSVGMPSIPSDSKRLTSARDGSAPGDFVRGGPGGRRRGEGRLTGRQCPTTTRGGHRWRSEAAERSVGMLLIPSDSKRLTSARYGSAPVGFVRGGPGGRRRGVGRLTGCQCPKTTGRGCRWRSEAAERSVGMLLIPPDSKRLTSVRDGSAPVGFAREGSGCRRRGVGRLTGRQCPKTTRGGFRWRSEAAERSGGLP
jgi:hypothetical protein